MNVKYAVIFERAESNWALKSLQQRLVKTGLRFRQ